jgi:hypothetical protein
MELLEMAELVVVVDQQRMLVVQAAQPLFSSTLKGK